MSSLGIHQSMEERQGLVNPTSTSQPAPVENLHDKMIPELIEEALEKAGLM
jgi:hypothetical protein